MRRFLAISAVIALFYAASAQAVGRLADITLYDRSEGRTLPVYQHLGRYYVVGKPGNEYQIVVNSRQSGDLLSVMSVDGVNVVSGETAEWGQTGYVYGAHQSYAVLGWRKSLDRIAAFYFTDHADAYASRTGRPANVGVIGVALFRRRGDSAGVLAPPLRRQREEQAAPAAPASDAAGASNEMPQASRAPLDRPRDAKLGTGHGRSESSVVTNVAFDRESATPNEIVTIYYDTYRNLVARGVIRTRDDASVPRPFPGQFVPDPR